MPSDSHTLYVNTEVLSAYRCQLVYIEEKISSINILPGLHCACQSAFSKVLTTVHVSQTPNVSCLQLSGELFTTKFSDTQPVESKLLRAVGNGLPSKFIMTLYEKVCLYRHLRRGWFNKRLSNKVTLKVWFQDGGLSPTVCWKLDL